MADDPNLPDIQVEPSSAPFELPATHKVCPDCKREVPAPGITYPCDPLRPLSEFYATKAKGYADGVRYSAYCIPHQNERRNASRRGKLLTEAQKQAHNAAQLRYRNRHKGEPRTRQRRWEQQHKEAEQRRWKRWVAQNPQRRRAQALASYHRRKRHGSAEDGG